MSEEGRDRFEIPKEMRSMAEASFDQARKAFEKFLASAQATAGSIEERGATVRAGAKDIGAKAISYAEKNVQASLDYAQSLLHAKDLTEVMRLHGDYVQAQMRVADGAGELKWARLSAARRWMPPSQKTEEFKGLKGQSADRPSLERGGSGSGKARTRALRIPTPTASAIWRRTLNYIALHKIDMIRVLSVGCPIKGHFRQVIQVDVPGGCRARKGSHTFFTPVAKDACHG